MRMFILTFVIVSGVLVLSPSDSPALGTAMGVVTLDAQQTQPPPQTPAPQINVEVKREGGRAWYLSPTWMAIGAIALVLLILLIVMASRGSGGATIVKG